MPACDAVDPGSRIPAEVNLIYDLRGALLKDRDDPGQVSL